MEIWMKKAKSGKGYVLNIKGAMYLANENLAKLNEGKIKGVKLLILEDKQDEQKIPEKKSKKDLRLLD